MAGRAFDRMCGAAYAVEHALEDAVDAVKHFPLPKKHFRPAGVKAGHFPPMPWWHHAFHDPYERVNVFSHGIPALGFWILAISSFMGWFPGGTPMALFGLAAATTHTGSTIAHLWPDDEWCEKGDHMGITALIIGVPISASMSQDPEADVSAMLWLSIVLMCAAFTSHRTLRTLGYILGGAGLFLIMLARGAATSNLCAQCVLYLTGGVFYIRSKNWNSRDQHGPQGLSDHHLMHYFVTTASVLQVYGILHAHGHIEAPWPHVHFS
ncbi:unnamed protein product [Pedinophyceae sp. YPF-701]|nr:unnamed protein product [Pedinophyceae sp. YPF-701]